MQRDPAYPTLTKWDLHVLLFIDPKPHSQLSNLILYPGYSLHKNTGNLVLKNTKTLAVLCTYKMII